MSQKITRRGFVQTAAALAPLAAFTPVTFAQSSTKAPGGDAFDVVVVGTGHNSLIAACFLAKAGYKVVALEGRGQIGGGTKTAELTLRGFHHDVCSCDHGSIQGNPALKELKLSEYGLEYIFPDPVKHVPFADGSYITEWMDFDKTVAEIAKYSKKDADTYVRMANEADAFRKGQGPSANGNLPIGSSEPVARKPVPQVWQRRLAMSKYDVMRHNFEDDRTLTFMMTPWPVGVTEPNTGMSGYPSKNRGGSPLPKGGSGMLAVALGRCLEAHGGVIMTNKPVEKLIIEGGKCVGVECGDGSAFRAAKAVVSTVHVKRLVDMAPKELWGDDFLEGVSTFDTGAAGFNTHYATTEPLKYPVKGGVVIPVHSSSLTNTDRAMQFEFEQITGEVDLISPVLHIVQPSAADPTRAPAGMHTIRILGRQPWNLRKGGTSTKIGPERWDEVKEEVADAHLRIVQKNAPNLTNDKILARFITTPVDIERMNPSMWHGSCHGGTDGLAQSGAMRPVPGWAQYRMPIPGLYQTGGTTHPGGGVGGWPGRNAASVILKDFGTSLEEVVKKA